MRNKTIAGCILALLLCMIIHTQEALGQVDPSLIVCHKYDNVNLGNDGSSYNNDLGTPFSMPLTTDHNGTANSAYVFTPTNFARIPHNPNQYLGSCFTIAAWVKPSAGSYGVPFNGRIDIVSKWGSGMASYVMSLTTSGNLQAHTYNGSSVGSSVSAGAIAKGVWSHIAITFDGAKMRFYINGVLNTTANHTVIPTGCTYPIGIGHEGDNVTTTPPNTGTGFNGAIDEVRIFKRILAPAQIQYVMNEPVCPTAANIDEHAISLVEPFVVCENKPYTLALNEIYYLNIPHTIYWGDGSSSSGNTHTYTDTGMHRILFVIEGNCPDTAEMWIMVDDCNVCKVEMKLQRRSCHNFTLGFTSKFINVECHKWLVDGVVIQNYDSVSGYNFTPGTHQICLKVFGPNIHYPNQTCCGEKCMTISIPIPTEQYEEITRCNLAETGTITCTNVNLNDYAPAGAVSYNHPILPILTSGSQEFCLEAGTYVINYFDSDGCVLHTLHLTVILTQEPAVYCSKSIVDICTYTTDPNTVMPDCDTCGEGANTVVGPAVFLWEDTPNQTRYYYREIRDITNCRVCYFGFSISVYSQCLVAAQFTPPVPVPPTPFRYSFTNISMGQGVPCGVSEWRIYQKTPLLWMPLGSPVTGTQMLDYTFPGPGEYRVCMTVSYCFCGQQCPGTYCMTFIIHPDGSIEVTGSSQELMSQENDKEDTQQDKPINTALMSNANVKIQPNPSGGLFTIIYTSKITATGKYAIELTDMAGKVVMKKDGLTVNVEETLDLSAISNGFYVVKIIMGEEVEAVRILKH